MTQQINTFAKSTIETLEKGVKHLCSELTINTAERSQWRCYGVFIVNSEHISHLSLANFEQVNVFSETTVFKNNPLQQLQRCI